VIALSEKPSRIGRVNCDEYRDKQRGHPTFCCFEWLVCLPEQFEECAGVRVLMKLLGARVARIEDVVAYIADRRPSGTRHATILPWPAAAEKQNVGWPGAARLGETAAGVCQKINQSSQL
jgi:hypothetical protein